MPISVFKLNTDQRGEALVVMFFHSVQNLWKYYHRVKESVFHMQKQKSVIPSKSRKMRLHQLQVVIYSVSTLSWSVLQSIQNLSQEEYRATSILEQPANTFITMRNLALPVPIPSCFLGRRKLEKLTWT